MIFAYVHLVVRDTPGLLDDNPSSFSIVRERGFAETFQYIKSFWLVVMFLWLVRSTWQFGYVAWALTFAYIGLDDLLQIHEEVGYRLSVRFQFSETLGLRSRDVGELAVFAVAGIVLAALLVIAYAFGNTGFRATTRRLLGFVAVFAFLGIFVDALHILFLDTGAGWLFGLVEDGGELIVLSLICWYVLVVLMRSLNWREDPELATPRRTTGRHTR